MFDKILVALDHSIASEQTFDEALNLAQSTQAQLMLVHVLTPQEETYPISNLMPSMLDDPAVSRAEAVTAYLNELKAFKAKGLELLRSHAERAIQQGIQTDYQQPDGYPGRVLCDVAQNWNADVIVIGRRSRNVLNKVLLGSVSNYVSHHAHCSVLIAHTHISSEFEERQQEKQTDRQFTEH
jgi:nucleotide-binding universal stress UspA family protein